MIPDVTREGPGRSGGHCRRGGPAGQQQTPPLSEIQEDVFFPQRLLKFLRKGE